ncbi:S8 family serine peptidase [Streptomyces sp. NPDC012438]|uniref:S8 family serine peptidase n=1 Tax=Streptomyces sp. NPDC012438 TaxID=3364833 RepID=UPI0036ED22D4
MDQAVADGVDVINYSLGAAFESTYDDPAQVALRNAAAAGVFVATAAGNSGPGASSLSNTAPWTTTSPPTAPSPARSRSRPTGPASPLACRPT